MKVTDLKNGVTFEMDGKLYNVIEYLHVSRPRLSALIKTKIKNIETGQVLEKNFGPTDVVGEVSIERKDMQYSYNEGNIYYFMDEETYDLVPFDKEQVEEALKFCIDGTVCTMHYANDRLVNVTPPLFVEMVIVECEPAVQGDTTRTAFKPAKMENGLQVRVPLFVNQDDKIKIDTRTGEYVERVKK